MRYLAAALLLLAAACSDSTDEPPATPQETVTAWLASFDGTAAPSAFVVPGQLPLLAAMGRGDQAGDIVVSGLSAEAEAEFWSSFSETVEGIAGVDMGDLVVTRVNVLGVDGVDHGFVTIAGPSGATSVVVRGVEAGRIDMVTTTGPGLVRPLRSLLATLPQGVVDGPTLAASLRAGLLNPELELPPVFYGETQDLIALIDR